MSITPKTTATKPRTTTRKTAAKKAPAKATIRAKKPTKGLVDAVTKEDAVRDAIYPPQPVTVTLTQGRLAMKKARNFNRRK